MITIKRAITLTRIIITVTTSITITFTRSTKRRS